MNVITHSRCVLVFGLNAMLFQVSQRLMSFILEVEMLSILLGYALIDVTSGPWECLVLFFRNLKHVYFISFVLLF